MELDGGSPSALAVMKKIPEADESLRQGGNP